MKSFLKALAMGCTWLTGAVMIWVLVTSLSNIYLGTNLGIVVGPAGSRDYFDSPKVLIDLFAWETMLGVFFSMCLIISQMDWIWEKIKKYPVIGTVCVIIYVSLIYTFFYFLMKDINGGDLNTAIEKNDVVVLEEMIDKANPGIEKSGFYFIEAARFESKEVIPVLIKHGFDINGGNTEGTTALMAAAGMWFRPDMVDFLLRNGADANVKDKAGETALSLAQKNFDSSMYAQEDFDKIMELLK